MTFPSKGKLDGKEIDIKEFEFENFLKHNMIRFGPLWHIIRSVNGTEYFHVVMIIPTAPLLLAIMSRYVEEFGTESVVMTGTELLYVFTT